VALVSDCFSMTDLHSRPRTPSVPLDVVDQLDAAAA
jgi:hypothetical protein